MCYLFAIPFSDLSGSEVRPSVVVNGKHESTDIIVVPLTSRTTGLKSGEFVLTDFRSAGLNVPSANKRGFRTLDERFVLAHVGRIGQSDLDQLDRAILYWLGFNPKP
jgi:mRNA interferase MazF